MSRYLGPAAVGRRENVTKGLAQAAYYGPQLPSASRVRDTSEAVAGAALLAWGIPRLKITGSALKSGRRIAQAGGARNVSAMFADAQNLATAAANFTRRGEMGLRRSRSINELIETVPAGVRGEVATAAGLLLTTAPGRRENRMRR